MEALLLMNTTADNNNQIGNPNTNFITNRTLYSHPSKDLLLASFLAGSHFAGGNLSSLPPPLPSISHSYPPAVSISRPPRNSHHNRRQPPLLPLPVSTPLNHQKMNNRSTNSTSNCDNIRSSPGINKNVKARGRGRDHSLTPKKSKNQKMNSNREEADLVQESSIDQMSGPDPKDLPKDVIARVFSSSVNKSCDVVPVDKFSGCVMFTPSPPPSSLPLPTFSLRPKLSCNVEAAAVVAGVDAGATDGLRRLLRL